MLAIAFEFPGHRYHATPWRRGVNEADVAWPPEPVRLMRTLIATWWRKADHALYPKPVLDDLVDTLASELPEFSLPDGVHSHIRAFMPSRGYTFGAKHRVLIYDAFLRLDHGARMVVVWRSTNLEPGQWDLCLHLVERIGYLGRAESWVQASLLEGWDGEISARPSDSTMQAAGESEPVELAAPVTPDQWLRMRPDLQAHVDGLRTAKGGADTRRRKLAAVALNERLSDALSIDTSDWKAGGWSNPPPLREVLYDRPALTPLPPARRRPKTVSSGQPDREEVARFVLAGRPAPRIEETLRIGEITRLALMSGSGPVPRELSGRDDNGALRDDPRHGHAFFLPEDADDDGLIDHVVVYCRRGFSQESRRRLDRLRKLWLERPGAEDDRGREEWRVALEDIGSPGSFAGVSALLKSSAEWISCTPYLRPWFLKPGLDLAEQVFREARERGLPDVRVTSVHGRDHTQRSRRALEFRRVRMRRRLVQPDKIGAFLTIEFAESVNGPIALGFACHYGLGLFSAKRSDDGT